MTVGELRAALARYNDDQPLQVAVLDAREGHEGEGGLWSYDGQVELDVPTEQAIGYAFCGLEEGCALLVVYTHGDPD